MELETLFKHIENIIGIKDIAYHQIEDGSLKPIYKTYTDKLTMEAWKEYHHSNPVYVKDSILLQEIVNDKKVIYIYDTKNDAKSPKQFFELDICTVFVIPLVKDNVTVGFIEAASLGNKQKLTEEGIQKCIQLVNKYL